MTLGPAYCSSSSDCDTCECEHTRMSNGHVYCNGRGEYHPPVRGCGCYQPIKGLAPTTKQEPEQPPKSDGAFELSSGSHWNGDDLVDCDEYRISHRGDYVVISTFGKKVATLYPNDIAAFMRKNYPLLVGPPQTELAQPQKRDESRDVWVDGPVASSVSIPDWERYIPYEQLDAANNRLGVAGELYAIAQEERNHWRQQAKNNERAIEILEGNIKTLDTALVAAQRDSELLEKHTVLVGGELDRRFLAIDDVLLDYVNVPKTVGTRIELQYRSERDRRCVFRECGDTSDNLDRIIAAYETRDILEIYGAIRNAIAERAKR